MHLICRSFTFLPKRAGPPQSTFFYAATRHTCCRILRLQAVNPKAVSLRPNHSSVAFMLQKYARYFLAGFGDGGAMD